MTEGLRVGGASLATANNDLEQASSLIIAGTEVMRDSNTVNRIAVVKPINPTKGCVTLIVMLTVN